MTETKGDERDERERCEIKEMGRKKKRGERSSISGRHTLSQLNLEIC